MAKKKKRSKKKSVVSTARLGLYGLAFASEAIRIASSSGDWKTKVDLIAKQYTGRNRAGQLNIQSLVYAYGPVMAFAIIDSVLSKLGVYKKMGALA